MRITQRAIGGTRDVQLGRRKAVELIGKLGRTNRDGGNVAYDLTRRWDLVVTFPPQCQASYIEDNWGELMNPCKDGCETEIVLRSLISEINQLCRKDIGHLVKEVSIFL